MTDSNPTSSAKVVRFFLRLLLALIVLGLIAVALYFAIPYLYREVVQPVRDNAARLDALEERLAGDSGLLDDRLTEAQSRLDDLEATLSTQSAQLAGAQKALTPMAEVMLYEATQVGKLRLDLDGLAEQIAAQETRVAELESDLADSKRPLSDLRRELVILQTMGLVTRAQVYLAQNNFGLAEEQVLLAARVLRAAELEGMDAWLGYLDQAAAELPDFPVLAASKLELAWQMMTADGLPALPTLPATATPTPFETPTPETTLTPSPTPFPTFTSTP